MNTKNKKAVLRETERASPETEHATVETDASASNREAIIPVPEPPPLSAEEIQELKEQAAKAKQHWENVLRTTADFENFKKRVARERQEASKYLHESILKSLIPVLDNFDMALAASSEAQASSVQSLQAGVRMIHQQLRNALREAGLEEIDATNKTFDPNWHEAVSQQETTEVPEGQVVQQLRKGYKLRDRLLRPAGVIVAKRPSS